MLSSDSFLRHFYGFKMRLTALIDNRLNSYCNAFAREKAKLARLFNAQVPTPEV